MDSIVNWSILNKILAVNLELLHIMVKCNPMILLSPGNICDVVFLANLSNFIAKLSFSEVIW